MGTKEIEVSIIIVHYKNTKVLFECLESIKKTKPKVSFETIVVDNDEKATVKQKLSKRYPGVKYIRASGNIGYSSGNNLGARHAQGEYILILNPDTKVFPKTIDNLVRFLEKETTAAIAAPNFVHKDLKPYKLQGSRELTPLRAIFSLSFVSKLFPNNSIKRKYFLNDLNFNKTREVDTVPGSCFLVRKSAFNKAGGFDENFFLFFEEADLCRRIKSLGYKVFMISEAKVIHLHKKSTPKTPEIKKIFRKSRYYYFRKHFGLLKAILTETLLRINPYILLLLVFNLVFFLLRYLRIYIFLLQILY